MPDGSFFDDREWMEDACHRVAALYTNKGNAGAAETLAMSHRYAVQYLEQAPALLPFVTMGAPAVSHHDRVFIARRFGEAIYTAPRLKTVLARFGASQPIRKILGGAVMPSNYQAIVALGKIPPSELSQAIPEKVGQQRTWLLSINRLMSSYARYMSLRANGPDVFRWGVTAFGAAIQAGEKKLHERVGDITDLLQAEPKRFNPAWTFNAALAATERWHEELTRREEARRVLPGGMSWDHEVDYEPLSISAEINGFTFTALRTPHDLFVEGSMMRHCVASYISAVAHGRSRIFSISREGRRVATMEVTPDGQGVSSLAVMARGRYLLTQIKGPKNSAVPAVVKAAAEFFVGAENSRIAEEAKARREKPKTAEFWMGGQRVGTGTVTLPRFREGDDE